VHKTINMHGISLLAEEPLASHELLVAKMRHPVPETNTKHVLNFIVLAKSSVFSLASFVHFLNKRCISTTHNQLAYSVLNHH
jgi:hypothetical protein